MPVSHRRAFVLGFAPALAATCLFPGLASAAVPAEDFVSRNIQAGLGILSNAQLSPDQRRSQFEKLLLSITDLKRIAVFTLGNYGKSAAAADVDAFTTAFQTYALSVYRSYFEKYSGQTLAVTGSRDNAPGDTIVRTSLSGSGAGPLEVDFRVNANGPSPVLTDIGIAGVWLALAERDDFAAFLSQNHGDVSALAAHLTEVAQASR